MSNRSYLLLTRSRQLCIAPAGWGAQIHKVSEGNDMPLYITALALSNGYIRIAIVDFDIGILTSAQDAGIRGVISVRMGH
jgi:hypothetical protein